MPRRFIPDSPIALVSKADLAEALGVAEYTVSDWIRKGILPKPTIRFTAKEQRWRVHEIDRWLERMERSTYVPPALRGVVKEQAEEKQRTRKRSRPRVRLRERVRLS